MPSTPEGSSSSSLTPLGVAELPWCRLHADYAGPFMRKMFLMITGSRHIVESATSEATIQKMKATFASHGLPVNLVTDNGSVFTSLKPSASVDLSEVVDRVSASVAKLRLKDSLMHTFEAM